MTEQESHGANQREGPREVARRGFLGYVAGAISSFIALALGIPVAAYLTSPVRAQEKGAWITLGPVRDFTDPNPRSVQFTITRQDGWIEQKESRTCWVIPQGGNKFTVFNGRCTHLGCAYSWQTAGEHAESFVCPCHGGVFTRTGEVVDGPPPRSLDTLEWKVESDQLMVLFQDFRSGVPNQAPV